LKDISTSVVVFWGEIMDVKELTEKLIQQEFGEWLIEMQFSGPFEWEDIDVDVVLSKEPADWVDRSWKVRRKLRDEGFNVLIAYDVLDGSDEE
jgi:hypothetical protein